VTFGAPEYFAITVVGLFLLTRISSASIWKGLSALGLGLALTTVGISGTTGDPRFTFGNTDLMQGVGLVPAVMGFIGMAEMIHIATRAESLPPLAAFRYREILPTLREWKEGVSASLRGSLIGFAFGLLPGPSMTLATFASYRLEKRLAPNEVGHGSLKAVAGPKSADDGAVSGTLVPLMALGLPFTSITAMLYAGLLLHGVTPGPTLITQRPEIFWGLVAAMYIGNIALLILNFPLVGLWVSVLKMPQSVLTAMLVVLMLIGAYSLRNNSMDMIIVLVMGMVGYIMKQLEFERTLVILGLVLGPMLETNFARSLQMSFGDLRIFVSRPIPNVLWALLVIVLLVPLLWSRTNRRPAALSLPEDT
jgi:putative tricarboxylic transport membrane protein